MRLLSCLLVALASVEVHGQEVLRVLNWSHYIDPLVLHDFEQKSGVKVDYQTFNTAEELVSTLAKGGVFDLVVPSHFQLTRMIRSSQLAPLDTAKLRNYRNIDPGLLAMLAGVDSANRYVVPYMWGTVGLVINSRLAEARYGGALPNSWSLLFDQDQAERLKGCGLGMLDAPQETASLWFNYRGRSLQRYGPRQIERNLQALHNSVGKLKSFENERYIQDLADGKLCVAMAWNGHALQAASKNAALQFQIPQEGSAAYIDSLAIPGNAPHPELAYRFIDFLLEPGNSVRNARVTQFYSSLISTNTELQGLAKEQPMQVLSAGDRRRIYMLESLSNEQKKALDQAWARLKTARSP